MFNDHRVINEILDLSEILELIAQWLDHKVIKEHNEILDLNETKEILEQTLL